MLQLITLITCGELYTCLKTVDYRPLPYLGSPITLFTVFQIGACVRYSFFVPESVNKGGNDRIDDGFKEPLIDPQQDRNHNARNAHHDCGSHRLSRQKTKEEKRTRKL